MFDDIELTNCPEEYALNCRNYEIKCHECKANSSGKYLQYNPINKNINEHPSNKPTKKKGVASYSRKGRKAEKKMINDIPYLVSNYASGSIGGDGDAHINLTNFGRVRVEIKNRFTEGGNIYPSSKEYKESKTQNISIILIQQHYKSTMFAYVEFKLWIDIWRRITFDKDIIMKREEYSFGHIYKAYQMKGVTTGSSATCKSLFYGEELNCPMNLYKDPRMEFSRMVTLSNGRHVMMHISTLSELIDLYNYVTLEE